ncbi:chromosome segregation protein SMC [Puteibacter caeruleilacunae]|nr:chromosome segregation protein SMC [Puteibacter caeruleilacunae]
MIKSIKLENFFSFGETETIELNSDTNILLGINGSGKSNFLKAIRLLYNGIVGDGFEKIFLKDWGGFSTVANFNQSQAETFKITYEFDKESIQKIVNSKGYQFSCNPEYEITIHRSGATSYFLEENIYSNDSNGDGSPPFTFLKMINGRGQISTLENNSVNILHYPQKEGEISFNDQELVLRQISDPHRFLPLFTLKSAIESIATYDYFDTTLKSIIRQPVSYGTEKRLLSSGENFMQILHRIKNHHPLAYEKIENLLRDINPYFKDISFEILGHKLYLVLREKALAKTVGIEHISDGTLRFLLLLSILYNPDRGKLICIDEPEIGLHPDMINTIAEAIKYASQDSQIIVATHSPLLLNSFELSDILIFEKDRSNKTIITLKDEDDFKEWDENYLVGQLWLNGKIGGKRW